MLSICGVRHQEIKQDPGPWATSLIRETKLINTCTQSFEIYHCIHLEKKKHYLFFED